MNSNFNINNFSSTGMNNMNNIPNRTTISGENKINKELLTDYKNTSLYKENYTNKMNPNTNEGSMHFKNNEFIRRDNRDPKEMNQRNITEPTQQEAVKNKEDNFKSITHFAKYLFFIAKKIAYTNNNTKYQLSEEVQKALVKHLIYKLNKILSSLINFNVLQHTENENIKQDIEYLCLKNSNITLNKIRFMLKRLEESNINYKYILHIFLKLKSYEDENKNSSKEYNSEPMQSSSVLPGLGLGPGSGSIDMRSEREGLRNEGMNQGIMMKDPSVKIMNNTVGNGSVSNEIKNNDREGEVSHSDYNVAVHMKRGNVPTKEPKEGNHSSYRKEPELVQENKNFHKNNERNNYAANNMKEGMNQGRGNIHDHKFSLAIQNEKGKENVLSTREQDKKDSYEMKGRMDQMAVYKNNLVNKSLYATTILNNKFHNLDIEENYILRDLVYPLQGLNGEYIKFNKQENAFFVYNRKVSLGMNHLIKNISHVGLVFKKIKTFLSVSNMEVKNRKFDMYEEEQSALFDQEVEDNLKEEENIHVGNERERNKTKSSFASTTDMNERNKMKNKKSGNAMRRGSLVIDALYQIIREYINEYYKLLSYIESDVNEHIHKNTIYIGIKKLYVLLQESYKILRVLLNVIDESLRNVGCNFLSFLYSKSQTYDYEEQKIYKRILQRCIKPINEIIKNWIEEGILKDKFNETFISTNKDVRSEEIWVNKFYLNYNKIPLFFSVSTAKKILLTGKSVYLINFFGINKSGEIYNEEDDCMRNTNHLKKGGMKNAIGNGRNDEDYHIIQKDKKNQGYNQRNGLSKNSMRTDSLLYDDSSDEEELIDIFSVDDINVYIDNIDIYVKKISKKKNKKLINLLISKFDLYEHFKAFRHFLLLVDGDLFETIFDNMKTDLYMQAEELKRHHLNNKLDICVKSASIFTSNPNIIKRLTIEKFNSKRGDLGWDVLMFDFIVDKPLNIIFTKKIKNIYKSINVLLIKLKRILSELSNMWYLFTHLFKIVNLVYYNSVLTYCNIIRNEMFHFVQNILSYFYYDVIDTSWQEFKNKIFTCNDLDELIKAHYYYITQIQYDLFLVNHNEVNNETNDSSDEDGNFLNTSLANDFYNSNSMDNEMENNPFGNLSDPISEDRTNNNQTNLDQETHVCLNKILSIIYKFINLTSAIISSVCENYSEIKKLTEERKEDRDQFENDIDYINNYINYYIIGEKTIKEIKVLLRYYRSYIFKFICLLLSENKHVQLNPSFNKRDKLHSLRLLASRLDFNLYYVKISKVIENKGSTKLDVSKQNKVTSR